MDHIGIDVHKKDSQICILVEWGELIEERIHTEPGRFAAVLGERPRARIVLEASTDSEWVARCVEGLSHESLSPTPASCPCTPPARARGRPTGGMPVRWPTRACSAPTAGPIGSPTPSAVPAAPAGLRRAGLGADGLGTAAQARGSEGAEGVHVDALPVDSAGICARRASSRALPAGGLPCTGRRGRFARAARRKGSGHGRAGD